jgi:hypothetical protein
MRSVAVLCLAALASCSNGAGSMRYSAPIYPAPGSGKAGCFAGPALQRGVSGSFADVEIAIAAGPWLVLDSMDSREQLRAYPGHATDTSAQFRGTLLTMMDTLVWTGGHWTRTSADSILFRELSTFPSAHWRLQVTSTGLRGQREIVSDLVARLPDGTQQRRVLRDEVEVVRVPCNRIPMRPPGWPSEQSS